MPTLLQSIVSISEDCFLPSMFYCTCKKADAQTGVDILKISERLAKVKSLSAPCSNRNRSTRKCRRKCCKRLSIKPVEPAPSEIARKDRTCSICNSKFYASGVQCRLGEFECIPNW